MNIKLTKQIEEANCITHSGTFHADEIFATIILSKVLPEVTLIRVPEVREKLNENIIVYDIGGGKFDHHQFGGNGIRPNGVKYAACGLIWKEFGRKLLEKYNVSEIEYTWKYIDENLIQFIDANDNGELPKLRVDYRNVHISYMISLYNPTWKEEGKVDEDEYFLKAFEFLLNYFERFIEDTIVKIEAKNMVDLAIENSKNETMILEKTTPWKEFLLQSESPKAKDINYVIFPSKRGGYSVYAVPVELGSFKNRKDLPKEWRGLRDENLQKITGVETARFCHNAGFICSCENKEDAIKLANLAVENQS